MTNALLADGAEQQTDEPAMPARSDDEQVRVDAVEDLLSHATVRHDSDVVANRSSALARPSDERS